MISADCLVPSPNQTDVARRCNLIRQVGSTPPSLKAVLNYWSSQPQELILLCTPILLTTRLGVATMHLSKTVLCSRFWGITESGGRCGYGFHPSQSTLLTITKLMNGSYLQGQVFIVMKKIRQLALFVTFSFLMAFLPATAQGITFSDSALALRDGPISSSFADVGDTNASAGDTGEQKRESKTTDYQSQQYDTPERYNSWAGRSCTGQTYTTGKGTQSAGDYLGPNLPQTFHGGLAGQSIRGESIRSAQYSFGFNGSGLPGKWQGDDYYNPAATEQDGRGYPAGGGYEFLNNFLGNGGSNHSYSDSRSVFPF